MFVEIQTHKFVDVLIEFNMLCKYHQPSLCELRDILWNKVGAFEPLC